MTTISISEPVSTKLARMRRQYGLAPFTSIADLQATIENRRAAMDAIQAQIAAVTNLADAKAAMTALGNACSQLLDIEAELIVTVMTYEFKAGIWT